MKTITRWICAVAMAVALNACYAAAQSVAMMPKFSNAQVSTRDASLQQTIASISEPAWLGYRMETLRPFNTGWDEKTYLEGEPSHTESRYEKPAGAPATYAAVLLRVAGGHVQRLSLQSLDREVDAGGLAVVWLNNVPAGDSIRVLSSAVDAGSKALVAAQATQTTERPCVRNNDVRLCAETERVAYREADRLMERGLMAIAQYADAAALPALTNFTAASYPARTRERAAFWIGESRGSEGLAVLTSLLKKETDEHLREQLVFDLTLVRGSGRTSAINELLVVAKSDADSKVRQKAQFWLAQQVSKDDARDTDGRVTASLGDQARTDPDAAIRKSAVFALSRLPADQGVPKLIQVAETAKDPATKREAIFWLGQEKDARALDYLEKMVKQ